MDQENKFDFNNLGLYFGPGKYEDLQDERMTELGVHFHEASISAYMGSFSADVLEQTKMYAERAGFENLSIEEDPDEFGVKIYNEDQLLARYPIEAYVATEDYHKVLPNGEEASNLEYYGWDGYKKLEQIVQEQDAEFGASVKSIPENNVKIEK